MKSTTYTEHVEHITITIPMPPSKLSLNSRIHWAVRQKLARVKDALAITLSCSSLSCYESHT
jgi:hypothetical protein